MRDFLPSDRLAEPRVSVGLWALAADTEEEAQRLASSARMTLRLLRRGRLIPVPPPDKAQRFLEQDGDPRGFGKRRAIIGTPNQVREGIELAAAEYGAEEAIVLTITHDHGARRRSYELIAEAFGLEAGQPAELEPFTQM